MSSSADSTQRISIIKGDLDSDCCRCWGVVYRCGFIRFLEKKTVGQIKQELTTWKKYDSEGEVMNVEHVEEIVIEQPEITHANLNAKIHFETYEDYERVD